MARDLEGKISARQIVNNAGMSAHPEYYSGRGARASDLNDRILENVYLGIQAAHGGGAAQQFAQMVADIPKLTATDFLLALYRLEGNDWKWDEKLLGNEKGIDPGRDSDDGRREAVALATICCALSGMSDCDQTRTIRKEFLERHEIKAPQRESEFAGPYRSEDYY